MERRAAGGVARAALARREHQLGEEREVAAVVRREVERHLPRRRPRVDVGARAHQLAQRVRLRLGQRLRRAQVVQAAPAAAVGGERRRAAREQRADRARRRQPRREVQRRQPLARPRRELVERVRPLLAELDLAEEPLERVDVLGEDRVEQELRER